MIVIIPFILVSITGKSVKAIKGVFPDYPDGRAVLRVTADFVAKYLGAELPAIVGSVICMAVVITMAKIFL